ncbi:MAG: YbhB/YbcL family Raf kinase inhibitor-like protein [Acidimicrobiales bacterium]
MVAVVILVLTGCGDDGTELRSPSPDLTTTTSTTSTTAAPSTAPTTAPTADAGQGGGSGTARGATSTAATGVFQLTSPAFTEGGTIPDEFTCIGADVSPPLAWSGVPVGTVELALVVRDPDAEGFVHWVVAGLPPTTGGLARGNPPATATEALNDFGRTGWSGPCPPSGVHHYDFRIYALSASSGLAADSAAAEAAELVETAPVLASAALSGTVAAP